MRDYGRRRSRLVVSAAEVPGGTRLYFGAELLPVANASTGKGGKPKMGFVFKALLGFHNRYSRALLNSAARRLS